MPERKPVSPADEAFLLALYTSTRQDEMTAWGWSLPQQTAFLQMQFRAQQFSYAQQYPHAAHDVIVHDGERVGRIIVAHGDDALVLVDISLLPAYRGAGLGGALMQALQAESAATGKPLRLQVLQTNPALHLYERLGFAITAEHEPYYAMQWPAPA